MGDILKEAIADAKAVRETALQNAKMALEEAFTPQLKSMLSAKLREDDDEFEDEEEFGDEEEPEPEAEAKKVKKEANKTPQIPQTPLALALVEETIDTTIEEDKTTEDIDDEESGWQH